MFVLSGRFHEFSLRFVVSFYLNIEVKTLQDLKIFSKC